MNDMDDEAPMVDVLDDYISERHEVKRKQGQWFPFSVGESFYFFPTAGFCTN